MQAQSKPRIEEIAVAKTDFVDAWCLLEKLVVSLHKIGSAHSTSTAADFTEDRRRQMLVDVGDYVIENLVDDANKLRTKLGDYLQDDEAERISDQLEYWHPADEQHK